MERDEYTQGRTLLADAAYGVDLCGKDFDSVYLEASQSLSHSFLNGTSFKNSVFIEAPINEAELAEAELDDCHFYGTDFSGSSFIGAKVDRSSFHACNFANGEWRQSHFNSVNFDDCNFDYTTVNLCTFDDCSLSGKGAKYLDNRSVNYNTFSRSRFDFYAEDDVVLASNLGLPSRGKRAAVANYGSGITLETVCLNSASGDVVVSELVDAIESELLKPQRPRLRALRLEFISNIIKSLAKISKISCTSLVYLENIFLSVAKGAESEEDALAAMSVLLNIRSLLFDMDDFEPSNTEHNADICRAIDIRYARTYGRPEVQHLAMMLGEIAQGNPQVFKIARLSNGSTIISLVATELVSVGAALVALNFTSTGEHYAHGAA